MKLFVIVFLYLSSLTACTKKDDNNSEIKQALVTSIRLLKLDEPIYMEIETDKVDKLHHAIFLSTVIKLGVIKEYTNILGTTLNDSKYFDLWETNTLCLAANYAINYAHTDKTVDNIKSIYWLEKQQADWIKTLRDKNFRKTLEQTNCLDKIS